MKDKFLEAINDSRDTALGIVNNKLAAEKCEQIADEYVAGFFEFVMKYNQVFWKDRWLFDDMSLMPNDKEYKFYNLNELLEIYKKSLK
jgi:hypothetical protein